MKKVSIPVLAFSALAIAYTTPSTAADVTMATCVADYNAMLAEAERNRQNSITEIEYALSRTTDDETAARLQREMETSYEIEESFRNMASVGYRDCISYVKSKGS